MRSLRVKFLATMYTRLETEEVIQVPDDGNGDQLDEILYKYQKEAIDGGEYTVTGSDWDNVGYEVIEEVI